MKVDLRLSQSLDVPFIFEISASPTTDFKRVLEGLKLSDHGRHNVLILTGTSAATNAAGDLYENRLAAAGVTVRTRGRVRSNSIEDVRRIDALCADQRIDLIVAIGGGKVIDVAKAVITRRSAALVVIPSALSSDCIASPVAVLSEGPGAKVSFPSGVPSCVFVDLELLRGADKKFALSGMGDILSNASALLDVKEYERATNRTVNGFAKVLAESAYRGVLDVSYKNCAQDPSLTHIASGLVLSGLAMAFAGSSLPCSGAEHLISHAMDHLRVGRGTHGLQVAMATLYCSALRDLLGLQPVENEVLETIRRLEIASSPEALGVSKEEFLRAVSIAPTMRAGRVSVLSADISPQTYAKAYISAFAV